MIENNIVRNHNMDNFKVVNEVPQYGISVSYDPNSDVHYAFKVDKKVLEDSMPTDYSNNSNPEDKVTIKNIDFNGDGVEDELTISGDDGVNGFHYITLQEASSDGTTADDRVSAHLYYENVGGLNRFDYDETHSNTKDFFSVSQEDFMDSIKYTYAKNGYLVSVDDGIFTDNVRFQDNHGQFVDVSSVLGDLGNGFEMTQEAGQGGFAEYGWNLTAPGLVSFRSYENVLGANHYWIEDGKVSDVVQNIPDINKIFPQEGMSMENIDVSTFINRLVDNSQVIEFN